MRESVFDRECVYESESWGVHVRVACVCACVREREGVRIRRQTFIH